MADKRARRFMLEKVGKHGVSTNARCTVVEGGRPPPKMEPVKTYLPGEDEIRVFVGHCRDRV